MLHWLRQLRAEMRARYDGRPKLTSIWSHNYLLR